MKPDTKYKIIDKVIYTKSLINRKLNVADTK
jgi:hypothetical protein